MAPGVDAPLRTRRPAKGSYPVDEEWTPDDLGERAVSEKKVRKVRRDVEGHSVEGRSVEGQSVEGKVAGGEDA